MKELSIEEKAKAYDKALAIARDFYNSKEYAKSHAEVKATYEAIFPELAESKNERIRKELIEFVKSRGGFKQEYIAWLEKQDEQKPANWLQELEDKLANATPQQLAEWKEKYFKEEPVEWSEEDEENFARVDYACLKTYGGDSYSSDWLRKFLGIHKKWKPSDRQMNVLEYYMHTLACNEHKEILFGLYQDLKKLKE